MFGLGEATLMFLTMAATLAGLWFFVVVPQAKRENKEAEQHELYCKISGEPCRVRDEVLGLQCGCESCRKYRAVYNERD